MHLSREHPPPGAKGVSCAFVRMTFSSNPCFASSPVISSIPSSSLSAPHARYRLDYVSCLGFFARCSSESVGGRNRFADSFRDGLQRQLFVADVLHYIRSLRKSRVFVRQHQNVR